jgi:hypothetical protein
MPTNILLQNEVELDYLDFDYASSYIDGLYIPIASVP